MKHKIFASLKVIQYLCGTAGLGAKFGGFYGGLGGTVIGFLASVAWSNYKYQECINSCNNDYDECLKRYGVKN